jgi:ABC-type arginine transport system ATPase subunit
LPYGVIHADLFPDNVFFLDDAFSGMIDFYFACSDFLAYDLAVCLNAWAFERRGEFNLTKGRALIASYETVRRLEPRERGCAMVFQNYALYPHMSVAENIGYALKVSGVSKAERQQRIAAVAQTVGLSDFLDRKPGALSGGQWQRVAMARAMIREYEFYHSPDAVRAKMTELLAVAKAQLIDEV